MATAGIAIKANTPAQQSITTTDGAQSLISCTAYVSSVLVGVRDDAGDGDGRVVTYGATQAGAENTAAQIVRAGGSLVVTPEMCGGSSVGSWAFSVSREAATNATFFFTPSVGGS